MVYTRLVPVINLKYYNMKRQNIELWDGLTEYRPPIFNEYEFNFKVNEDSKIELDPKTTKGIMIAVGSLNRLIDADLKIR